MSENLLYTMSSVGTMSIDVFNANFSKLIQSSPMNNETFDIKNVRSRIIRILSALGHCEVDFDHRFVSVCTPSIVALPRSGLPRMVWCGARTKFLVDKLSRIQKQNKEEISFEIFQQTMNANFSQGAQNSIFPLPDAIIINALSEDFVKKILPDLKVERFLSNSPVLPLIDFSVDVKELKKSLNPTQVSESDWKTSTFNVAQLKFERGKTKESEPSLSSYESPITQQKLHLYWDNGKGHEIDKDWGRWLALSEHKKSVICYDKRMQILAVPASLPLPVLLARSVSFCSGRSPRGLREKEMIGDIPPDRLLDAYDSVPILVAEEMAKKLGQNLLFHRFKDLNLGA